MLRFSRKVEYALIALIDLADKQKLQPVTARSLASSYNLPQELLGKILQTLTKKNILESIQGIKGGYILRQRSDKIRLKEIIEILDGPISLVQCYNESTNCECEQLKSCNIKSPVEIIQSDLMNYFDTISLATLKESYSLRKGVKQVQAG